MRKTLTLFASLLVVSMAFAQKPTAEFDTVKTVAPLIDGIIDAEWDNHTKYDVNKDYTGEVPSVGSSYFKACWADSGIFVMVYVDDDVHVGLQSNTEAGDPWTYDKVEIYFDVNDGNLEDGKGPGAGGGSSDGHHQFAFDMLAENITSAPINANNGAGTPFVYGLTLTNPSYVVEYFIPFSSLMDDQGFVMAETAEFGFDVNITDRDALDADGGNRQRKMWANIGTINENWNNMNDAGTVTLLGAEDLTYVDEITLNASATTIDVNNGTVDLTVGIIPANATNQVVSWVLSNDSVVSITSEGMVRAIRNGDVEIYASSTDGGYIDSDPVTITVSNQILTLEEANVIKNGDFSAEDPFELWGGWVDGPENGGEQWVYDEGTGAAYFVTKLAGDGAQWHYQFNQQPLNAMPDIEYTLKFKAWSSAERPIAVDFEDVPGNNYNRYGASSDERAVDGRSEWQFSITTEPAWYEFKVVFDQMVENTVQKLTFMLSQFEGNAYIDSIYLVSTKDLAIVGVEESSSAIRKVNLTQLNVYPNPVGEASTLQVRVDGADTKLAIINMVGQRVIEAVTVGKVARINVADLPKGLYIVQLEDGSSKKFIR